MTTGIIADLEQQRRDALAGYYLGQLVPSAATGVPDNIITPEDLYEYLLIDNQVSADVDTSRVAQGIASIQQHVHAIYNGMEPGFERVPDMARQREALRLWHEGMSQYGTWAGYQMLADYPENYLDPSLRLGKTEAFKAFENELAQARLTQDAVQTALSGYLTRFEETSNLTTECCYIDGVDLRHADYYFIGRSTVEPTRFYWRKAAIDLNDDSTHIPPSAWSEWKRIDVQTADTVRHVRTVVVEGRLHFVWLEQMRQSMDANDSPIADSFIYQLNISYLQSDGQWSAATCLEECVMPSLQTLESGKYVLVATFDHREQAQPRLAVGMLAQGAKLLARPAFITFRDKYWQPVTLSESSRASLFKALNKQIGTGSGRAQHLSEGAEVGGRVWTLDRVVWNRSGDNHMSELNRYLELHARIKNTDGVGQLETVGVCNKPWYQTVDGVRMPLRGAFGMWQDTPRSPHSLMLNGAARTPIEVSPWGMSTTYTLRFGMPDKNTGLGYNEFTVSRKERSAAVPTLTSGAQGGQFLDLQALALPKLRYVRLNTTFAAELVRKAERSLDGALGWEAQHTPESPVPGSTATVPVDFNGANGRYFWELFFHVPHLAAWRLYQSFDHGGAERWLHYLFNPQMRVAPLYPPPGQADWLPYWTSRPLAFADDPLRDVAAPRDPDVIASGAPSHYRKAVFMLYLDNLIAWGDTLYRQLTRDALSEAQLLYVRALSLLGPLSKGRSISQWDPKSLADAAAIGGSDTFATFEASGFEWLNHDTPRSQGSDAWIRLIDAQWFRLPVNTRLLDLWEQLDRRLYNLRNQLTLEGRPMLLALYEAPANPLDLMRAQLAGSSTTLRRLGAQAIIPPYRFAAMLPRTREAVDTLIRFGDQVRQGMESRSRAEQDTLQQSHLLELGSFVEQLDALAIEQAQLNLATASASREPLQAQLDTYDKWLAQDVSDAEQRAEDIFLAASTMRSLAAGGRAAGHALGTAPNTITFLPGPVPVPIPGGWHWGGPPWSAASILEAVGVALLDSAEAQLRTDVRNRRRDEWKLLKDQAQHQFDSLTLQIEQHEQSIQLARLRRERSLRAREQAQSLYAFIQNRATNVALYQWLLGQMSALYFQAYDAVLSLCLATQACWQYEIGDPDTTFIPTGAWLDNRQGLTAGESLALGLLRMESAFLMRHERRLELVKTVSLRRLLQDYSAQGSDPGWASVLASLRETGTLEFQLTPSLFDRDYPGHYLRQVTQVSLSLPGVLGAYENARAVLSQLTSSYLLKPDLGSAKYMYQQARELSGEHDDINPRFVIAHQRANQQIAIGGNVQDSTAFGASYADERYQAFEGTGAVSCWSLSFPRYASAQQQTLFGDLQDIIMHVRYRAVDGGKLFADQIRALKVASVRNGQPPRRPPQNQRALPPARGHTSN